MPLACITPELPLSKVTPGETFTRVGEISMMDSKYPFSMLATSFGVPIVNCSLIALSFLPLNVYQTCKLSDLHYGTNRAFHMVQTILKCTCGIFCLPTMHKDAGAQCFFTIESSDWVPTSYGRRSRIPATGFVHASPCPNQPSAYAPGSGKMLTLLKYLAKYGVKQYHMVGISLWKNILL